MRVPDGASADQRIAEALHELMTKATTYRRRYKGGGSATYVEGRELDDALTDAHDALFPLAQAADEEEPVTSDTVTASTKTLEDRLAYSVRELLREYNRLAGTGDHHLRGRASVALFDYNRKQRAADDSRTPDVKSPDDPSGAAEAASVPSSGDLSAHDEPSGEPEWKRCVCGELFGPVDLYPWMYEGTKHRLDGPCHRIEYLAVHETGAACDVHKDRPARHDLGVFQVCDECYAALGKRVRGEVLDVSGAHPLTPEQQDESFRMAVDAAYGLGYAKGYQAAQAADVTGEDQAL